MGLLDSWAQRSRRLVVVAVEVFFSLRRSFGRVSTVLGGDFGRSWCLCFVLFEWVSTSQAVFAIDHVSVMGCTCVDDMDIMCHSLEDA